MTDAARTRRVAVASSDGRLIDRHLGQSDVFRIYEVGAEGLPRLLEERRVPSRLDRHSIDGLPVLLGDVSVVLASRAGPGAVRLLNAAGVQVFALEGPVEPALAAVARRGFLLEPPPDRSMASAAACGPGRCDPGGCKPGDCSPGATGGCGGCS